MKLLKENTFRKIQISTLILLPLVLLTFFWRNFMTTKDSTSNLRSEMRTWKTYSGKYLTGVCSLLSYSKKTLVLLHGVGSNENDLINLGEKIFPQESIVSLRAPLNITSNSFAWFQVRFTEKGPIHNGVEALESLMLLENELNDLAQKNSISRNDMYILGFSQGAIMTVGLALSEHLELGGYIAISGRTLPEFATLESIVHKTKTHRSILLAHGTKDEKLPLHHAKLSRNILEKVTDNLIYLEFPYGHGIPESLIAEIKKFIQPVLKQ